MGSLIDTEDAVENCEEALHNAKLADDQNIHVWKAHGLMHYRMEEFKNAKIFLVRVYQQIITIRDALRDP